MLWTKSNKIVKQIGVSMCEQSIQNEKNTKSTKEPEQSERESRKKWVYIKMNVKRFKHINYVKLKQPHFSVNTVDIISSDTRTNECSSLCISLTSCLTL